MASVYVLVAYRSGSQLEIIKDGFSGYLWESGDELIEKIVSLLTNPENSLVISKNAYTRPIAFALEGLK